MVEATPPVAYEIVKEEDKNVDFGDEYKPSMLLLAPVCVGTATNTGVTHTVPQHLALFPGQMIPAPSAGLETPLCNMKQVIVAQGQNTASDFFMFNEVPKAARVVGFSNNDLSAEFNAGSPVFGEKASPSWIPVSFQDWQGNEVARVYTDDWGAYNALLPSTFTINPAIPTGVSPNLITAVLNHPLLSTGAIDPYYNPNYSVTPWTLDFWPGKTTYLDTPLVPVAAFAGFPQTGPDVESIDGTPVISAVNGPANGPVVCSTPGTVTITSMGLTTVPNPDFDPAVPGSPATVTRDYGFGTAQGTVRLNNASVPVTSWSSSSISVTVSGGASSGQLLVTRGDNGRTADTGITFHVSTNNCANVRHVVPGPTNAIQAAIDAAANGDLIIVEPGNYSENVILYKNVRLQGSGAGSTVIYANPSPANRLTAWHTKVQSILGTPGTDPFMANEAPGIMVLGSVPGYPVSPSLVDGFRIFGAIMGGGIYVDNDAPGMTISNRSE